MPVLKILGVALGAATAAFSIATFTTGRRCGLVRRGLKRPNGRRPETDQKARALAQGAEDAQGTRTAASDRCVLQAQARALARKS